MKIAIYARVSTADQEVENQLIQLREYCERQSWDIYREYIDVASGADNGREQFKQLFLEIKQKRFDILLFWSLSRFSRSGVLFTLNKLNELTQFGVNWHSYTEPYLSSIGPFKDSIISIFATLAEQERIQLSERTKAGLLRARANGKVLGRPAGLRDKKKRKRKYWKKPCQVF